MRRACWMWHTGVECLCDALVAFPVINVVGVLACDAGPAASLAASSAPPATQPGPPGSASGHWGH
eukprot:5878602-Prymnesium_polylepis.3